MGIDRGVHCMSKVFDENLSCSADMQSSLRDRIAAVLKEHRQVASSCECGFDLGLSAITWRWHDHLADAVIAELNLKIVVDYMSVDGQRRNFMLAGNYTTEKQ